MRLRLKGLWRNPDFLRLWGGETVSLLGSQVTLLAMPLVAAMTLQATPLQMGILGMVQYIPWLIVGLVAGALADRLPRRPIMIAADLGRLMLIGFIPLVFLAGKMRIEYLYLVGFLVGTLNVFFEVAYAAYLPSLVSRESLVEGNSKLQVSASVAEIAGPGLAGGLIQQVTAPLAVAVDALSFLLSAAALAGIRAPEARRGAPAVRRHLLAEIREGLATLYSNPILRAFALASTTSNFFTDIHLAVFVLYAMRQVKMEPVALGAVYAIASLGGLLGSLSAERLASRVGLGRVIVGGQTLVGLGVLAIPFSGFHLPTAVMIIAAAQALWGFAAVIFIVNAASLRQAITPDALQGRVAASLRFLSWGVSPLGFLLGGFLGERIGLRNTLLVAAIGPVLSLGWLLGSPVPQLRALPPSALGSSPALSMPS